MEAPAPPGLQARLEAYLARQLGRPARVEGLARLAGGVSRETWAFDLHAEGEAPRPLVLRMDTPQPFIEGTRPAEAALIRLAGAHGVPVPAVPWSEDDPAVLGAGFLVMERLAGESRVGRLLGGERYARARAALPGQMAEALAAIHRIGPETEGAAGLELRALAPAAEVAHQEALYRRWAVEPHPVLELALRWLHAHAPPGGPLALVHGDFRPGNMLFDERGLGAVLDWELAHFGDPMEDVAWVALRSWRGGRDTPAVGALATREAFHAAYEGAGGRPVEPAALRFWDVFALVRWAVVTVMELGGYLAGTPNIELASLGRRTAEIEWDLLALLEGAAAGEGG